MNQLHDNNLGITMTLALFEPALHTLYSLEEVARTLDLSRHWIALCARHGLIHPVSDPVSGIWYFDAEAIRTLRRIEMLRSMHGLNVLSLKFVLGLLQEVETLRQEVQSIRAH